MIASPRLCRQRHADEKDAAFMGVGSDRYEWDRTMLREVCRIVVGQKRLRIKSRVPNDASLAR
jgi:hypothetical protein